MLCCVCCAALARVLCVCREEGSPLILALPPALGGPVLQLRLPDRAWVLLHDSANAAARLGAQLPPRPPRASQLGLPAPPRLPRSGPASPRPAPTQAAAAAGAQAPAAGGGALPERVHDRQRQHHCVRGVGRAARLPLHRAPGERPGYFRGPAVSVLFLRCFCGGRELLPRGSPLLSSVQMPRPCLLRIVPPHLLHACTAL